ncbi:pyruvate dehydrogenase complex dihydrolipoamide acetyltransferase [Zavarzinia sp. CC-PAN008]|uniref:pyruvate dehydrogenase complex dihydrolipoamide acetyltransferase n=1 Tax=Zavarzinia sp. CC-PAN008 TaxID=3243332 RepID=UPI003F74A5AF
MTIQILMPALSPTMEEGKLAKWLVKVGDTVKSGDIIAEIETDKATMEFETIDEGVVAELLVAEGTEGVAVNTPIAVLREEGEAAGAAPAAKPAASAPPAAKVEAAPAPAPQPAAAPAAALAAAEAGERVFASPLARRIAKDAGLDLAGIAGTGPRGRIVKADVEKAAASPRPAAKAAPAAEAPKAASPAPEKPAAPKQSPKQPSAPVQAQEGDTAIPLDGMRRTVAKRMVESVQEAPHFYLTVDCELDRLLKLRTELNAKAGDVKISVNDMIVKACALALVKVPGVNASWSDDAILRHAHADVAIAVALDGGLITPIVWKAETKGLAQIARETKDLAERAKTKKLKPQEYQGGGFTVSNLGMFGIKHFTGIINLPHAAILAVGAGEKRPVVRGDELAIATVMTVTMSCDHRVVDGALGAQFLAAFKALVEDPITMLL